MTEKEVITELKKRGADQLQKDLDARGVAFEMDPDIEKSLRKAKATDQVIKAVTAAGPKEKAAAAKAAAMANGDIIIPPAENADYKALQGELDPDKVISLANAFITKYPQSTILSYAYSYEANGYKMKGDLPQVVEFAEKSVALEARQPYEPRYVGLHYPFDAVHGLASVGPVGATRQGRKVCPGRFQSFG